MANLFQLISLILGAFRLWDAFLDWTDEKYSKELEERRQARTKALSDLQNAQSEAEFDKAQDDLVSNLPKP